MKAPVCRSKRVTTPSAAHGLQDRTAHLGVAQELRLVQVVLLGDVAELGAVLFKVLVEPARSAKPTPGPQPRPSVATRGIGDGRPARDVARAAVGELGPVDKDRGRRQRRRQQATPGQGARTDVHGAIVRRP